MSDSVCKPFLTALIESRLQLLRSANLLIGSQGKKLNPFYIKNKARLKNKPGTTLSTKEVRLSSEKYHQAQQFYLDIISDERRDEEMMAAARREEDSLKRSSE